MPSLLLINTATTDIIKIIIEFANGIFEKDTKVWIIWLLKDNLSGLSFGFFSFFVA